MPVNDFPDNTPYIGLDWFVLDLLGSSLIFIFIEKLFALRRERPVFRPEWQTDMHHFIVNHRTTRRSTGTTRHTSRSSTTCSAPPCSRTGSGPSATA